MTRMLRRLAHHVGGGAAAGIGATGVMTAFMLLARRAGMLGELAPRTITRRAGARLGVEPREDASLELATAANHLAVGIGWGLLHRFSIGRLRLAMPGRLAAGALYGLAIWLASYWAILPRLGLMPRPANDERQRPQAMIAAHLVYGSVLAVLDAPASDERGGSGHSRSSVRSM